MTRMRAEEEWARSILSRALNARVEIHDTGERESMYDLQILYPDGSAAAGEVVAAADGDSITLWRLMNDDRADRWQVADLVGGWGVGLDPRARAKRVRSELPALLLEFERQGVRDLRDAPTSARERARRLGVGHAHQGGTDFPGSIYITVELPTERSGGMAPTTGDPLATWLGEYLHGDDQADVLRKLEASGTGERHAVVFVPSFPVATFPVIDLLMREGSPLPLRDPDLPKEISHVWAFSSWSSGDAFHWSPLKRWQRFSKFPGDDASEGPAALH